MKLFTNSFFVLLIIYYLFIAVPVSAQGHARPNFRGVAIDKQTKQPIRGMWIEMKSAKHGGTRYTKTDQNGVYFFRNDGPSNDGLIVAQSDAPTVPNCMLSSDGKPIAKFDPKCTGSWGTDQSMKYPQCSNCQIYSYENTAPGIPNGRKIMSKEDWGCRSSPFTFTGIGMNAQINQQANLGSNVLGETTSASGSASYKNCNSFSVMIDNVNDTVDMTDPNDVSKLCKVGEWKSTSDGQGGQVPYLDCQEYYSEETLNLECEPEKKTMVKVLEEEKAYKGPQNKDIACVSALPCAGKDRNGSDVKCADSTENASPEVTKARIKVSGLTSIIKETPSAENPVYIVQCNRNDNTFNCSTGNATYDAALGLTNDGSVQVKGVYEQLGEEWVKRTDGAKFESKIDDIYEWETTIPVSGRANYSFYAISEGLTLVKNGGIGGQQQGTLSFAGCTEITDPYGRVFDSHTLEPLENVQVSLLKQRSNGSFSAMASGEVAAGFKNPITTQKDGMFSFFVPDGTYKLDPKARGYTFPYDFTKLNDQVKNFYTDLYKGESIVQKGKIIHKDIPLDPIDRKASEEYARNNPARVMHYSQSLQKEQNILVINGIVSHPQSKVLLYSKVAPNGQGDPARGRLIQQATADNQGRFTLRINLNTLRKGEVIGEMDVTKHTSFTFDSKTLSGKTSIVAKVENWISNLFVVYAYTTTTTTQIDPLFNYIEGYAKDDKGTIMPNAKVQIMVPILKTAVYETTTDEKGYFKIYSENLPVLNYRLQFVASSGAKVTASTGKFLTQNTQLLRDDAINLFAYTPTNGEAKTIAQHRVGNQIRHINQTGEVAGVATTDTFFMKYISFMFVILMLSIAMMLGTHVAHKQV